MGRLGVGIFAFVVGVICLFVTQISLTRLWAALGVPWGREDLPILLLQQVGVLSTLFAAIMVGSFVAAVLAKRDAWRVLLVMCLVGVAIDGYAMFIELRSALPLWFRLAFVGTIPIATALAGLLRDQYWRAGSEAGGAVRSDADG